jgi:hypothetical protein
MYALAAAATAAVSSSAVLGTNTTADAISGTHQQLKVGLKLVWDLLRSMVLLHHSSPACR